MTSMRPLGIAVATIAGLTAALPCPAQQRTMPSAPGPYFGVGAGVGYVSYNNNDFNNIANDFNNAGLGGGGLSQSTSRETTDFGWKVFGGYRFNQYFALEGSYVDFGKFDYQYQFNQGGAQTGNGNMSYNAFSWNIAAVPRYTLQEGLFVQGKVGAAFTTVENSFNMSVPGFTQQGSDRKSRTNFLVGAGIGYDFPNGLSIIGEYEYYGEAGSGFQVGSTGISSGTGRADLNLFSISGMIRF
jgi:OOP family OmpA-OmpF porin